MNYDKIDRELFNSVFRETSLTEEVKSIVDNDEHFNELLKFYRELKIETKQALSLLNEPDSFINQKLAQKISAYKLANVFTLYPKDSEKDDIRNLFAAMSKSGDEIKNWAKSFIDPDNKFLVRIITQHKSSKLYLFTINNSSYRKAKITIMPEGQEVVIEVHQDFVPIKVPSQIETVRVEIIE